MFYYPLVLRRHSGCFSTIWLAATKGIKVTRRDFLKVNVISTCDDIMNYVLERVPPPQPGLPRPRFSLYLSSQLQYGVILVYHRQCALLLEELQSVVVQLWKKEKSQKIDMDEPIRQTLDFPDALSLLEETEGALDPLFGVMYMQDAMPSPSTLIQRGQDFVRETSPEHPELTLPAAAAPEGGITASPDSITLRETEPVAIPAAEFEGEELLDQHPDTINILMAQADNFPEGDLEIPDEEVRPGEEEEIERERGAEAPEKEKTKDLTGSTIELQPTAVSSEDALLLLQEEPGLSLEPGPPSDQHTPVSVPAIPSPPPAAEEPEAAAPQSEDVPPLEVMRRQRKRQLIFFDPETQISDEELQQQISNPLTETRGVTFMTPPSRQMPSAAELFNGPCTSLPEDVEFLWRQAATIQPLSDLDLQVGERGPESTDSEREREREMVEAAEAAEAAEVAEREEGRPEQIPGEAPRDEIEPEMFDISEHGSLPLEGSDQREASREIISPMLTPERDWPAVPRSASTLQDIPEVEDELMETAAAEAPGLLPALPERAMEAVLFQSLLPPNANRQTVGHMFQRLLENLSARKVCVEQDEPYGDMLIFPGPNFEEGLFS